MQQAIMTLILMLASGIAGWYGSKQWYKRKYQEEIWDLLRDNEVLEEANENLCKWKDNLLMEIQEKDKWIEDSSKIHQNIIKATMGDTEYESWKDTLVNIKQEYRPEVMGQAIYESEEAPETPSTYQKKREEEQKKCAKDIDRRIPGNSC